MGRFRTNRKEILYTRIQKDSLLFIDKDRGGLSRSAYIDLLIQERFNKKLRNLKRSGKKA